MGMGVFRTTPTAWARREWLAHDHPVLLKDGVKPSLQDDTRDRVEVMSDDRQVCENDEGAVHYLCKSSGGRPRQQRWGWRCSLCRRRRQSSHRNGEDLRGHRRWKRNAQESDKVSRHTRGGLVGYAEGKRSLTIQTRRSQR